MTEQEIKEARARCNAATPGPWKEEIVRQICGIRGIPALGEQNSEFIARSITDLPRALDEIERLRAALEYCRDYDRSPEPGYGEVVRGHKPGPGKRFKTPRERAREALRDEE